MPCKPPILGSGPIKLVPFEEKHLSDQYVSWLNDPLVMRYSENRHRKHDIKSCKTYVQSFANGPSLLWAVEYQYDNLWKHIGNITATIDCFNTVADVGILLGDNSVQNKGLGLVAWQLVIDYLFTRSDIHKITGGCLADNLAMLKIMKRSGMKPDGTRKRHYVLDGKFVDVIHMAIHVE